MRISLILIIFTIFSAQVFSKDARNCENINHPAYQDEYKSCVRMNIKVKANEQGVDCESCFVDQNEKNSSGLLAALSAIAQPAAHLLATYTVAKSQNEMQERWAKAYETGYQECTNRFTSYLNNNTTIGGNPITASQAGDLMSCNGYGYGAYAGYNGMVGNNFGGFGNPFLQNGFTSGYMNGFAGPYATGAYGSGMISASLGIGMAGTSGSAAYHNGITPAFGF